MEGMTLSGAKIEGHWVRFKDKVLLNLAKLIVCWWRIGRSENEC